MTFIQQDKKGKNPIKIEGPLSIYEVTTLKDELISCLETFDEIVIDLSGVTDCDIAGVQLLCAVRKTVDKRNQNIRIEKASAPIVNAFNNAGVNPGDILNLKESKYSNPTSKGEI